MKRVTKKSLDELALVMPVICEMNQRYYVGGNSGGYGDSGDSGGWGGNSGGYGDSGGWGGNSGGNGDYGSGSGYDYGSGNTGGYNGQFEGWKGDEGQYGSSIYDGVNNGGNYNSDSGEYSDPSRACSYSLYLANRGSGNWNGGYVQGIGYVGASENIPTSDNLYNHYTFEQAEAMMKAGTWKGGIVDGVFMSSESLCLERFKGGQDLTKDDLMQKLVGGLNDAVMSIVSEFMPAGFGTIMTLQSIAIENVIHKVITYMKSHGIESVYELVTIEQKMMYGSTYDYRTDVTYKYFDRSTGKIIEEYTVAY